MKKFLTAICLAAVIGGFAINANAVEAAVPKVLIKTSLGDIKIELYPKKAPMTVKNFLMYVQRKAYDGTIFHRVIANFMIQGGGFDKSLKERKGASPIRNEADNKLSNERGTIAMARTYVVDSATNQFFINLKNNSFLDHKNKRNFGYCVFGKVISGMDVVDKIAQVPTGTQKRFRDVPSKPVIIKEIVEIK
jgi:cyclophilin family peptidyl-prolyl cis-trans isomerase